MSFSKYTISNGAVSSMENENEYYLSCESYKSASSTSGTQAYFFRTTLTGSTSTINTQDINFENYEKSSKKYLHFLFLYGRLVIAVT